MSRRETLDLIIGAFVLVGLFVYFFVLLPATPVS